MQFSTVALLASVLANEAFASPLHQHQALHDRALRVDNVIVVQEIVVTAYADGVLKTGEPKVVDIKTNIGTPAVETVVRPISTVEETPVPTPTPEPEPTSTPEPEPTTTTLPEAVFKEKAPVAEPSTTTVQVSSAEPLPVVAPTTLQTIISSAAPVVTSAVPVPSTPATITGGKRGIAYNNADYLKAFTGSSSVSWCYNWGGNTHDVPESFEFVPMLWGTGSHANNWERFADTAIAAGSKHLLAFNEPDHFEQANISPSAAADGYKQYMEPYAGKAKLGSPAVTNGGDQMGLTWLGNFMTACSGCTIDFVNVHWYNGGDAAAFKTHMQKAYDVGGKRPIWITEWQAPGSTSEQIAFLAEVLPWLDSQDWIERHALFMASEGLMISGGGLSEVGKAFIA